MFCTAVIWRVTNFKILTLRFAEYEQISLRTKVLLADLGDIALENPTTLSITLVRNSSKSGSSSDLRLFVGYLNTAIHNAKGVIPAKFRRERFKWYPVEDIAIMHTFDVAENVWSEIAVCEGYIILAVSKIPKQEDSIEMGFSARISSLQLSLI